MKRKEMQYGVIEKIVFRESDFKIDVMEGLSSWVLSWYGMTGGIHEEIEIKYFYEGTATLMIGSEVIHAQPGDIVIANPYEIHSTIGLGEQRGKYHVITIGLDLMTDNNVSGVDLRSMLIKQGKCFSHLVRNDVRMQQLFLHIMEEYKTKDRNYTLVIQHLVSEFFLSVLQEKVWYIALSK